MYHVPTNDTWDAKFIADSLCRQNLAAHIFGDSVRVTLPAAQRFSMFGKLVQKLFPARPLYITISFHPGNFIRNVTLEYAFMKVPHDSPCFDKITNAMFERGYLVEDDREIAARYCPESDELTESFDRLEQLQIQLEESVLNRDFENAVTVRDEAKMIEKKIETMLFETVRRTPQSGNRDDS